MKSEIRLALELLRGSPEYIADAREGAPVGNSVVGSLLSLPPHSIPRQYAEQAVREALALLDREAEAPGPEEDGETVTLRRSGQPPLRFRGELLAESDGERQAGKEHNRWHELAVYRTAGGQFVVRIAYRTRWEGELDRDAAEVTDAPGVAAALRDYDPAAPVEGYPVGDAYAERQARLLADVRRRYEEQVSRILAADPEFAEEVE